MSTNSRSRSLLELPVDVMLCILDHAELHALFFLSQTCKTMQRLAKRDFRTMANTNVEGKVDFLLGLAYPYYKSCFGSYWGSYVSFSATPEIQSGRFLLHEKWHLNANLDPSPWRSNVYIPICNHLDFMGLHWMSGRGAVE
ncbi:hypothetical protein FOXB_04231 [Fusarium oxysporum f. sp. conglutinans Fo5176]|uniref:F-box domain-containing protein n=1 Tax=Fusarium oxysporum (strain Fo5176) TaxID=660025 RepID=F9FCV3_FUSOF|nr:hypothetical protein FOXB_04231 [Fusarium oxysporum f. sp. conglutinans Fo5176]